MKKLILSVSILVAGLFSAQKNSYFQVGANAGRMVGNFSGMYSSELEANIAYMWQMNDKFNLGVFTGYTHYLYNKNGGNGGVGGVPIAARLEYFYNPKWFFGGNFGLHLGTSGEGGSAIYFNPFVGTLINENIEIYGGYKGSLATETYGSSLSSINLGIAYRFK